MTAKRRKDDQQHQRLEETSQDPALQPPEGAWPCGHPGLRPPASGHTTIRFCGLKLPSEPTQRPCPFSLSFRPPLPSAESAAPPGTHAHEGAGVTCRMVTGMPGLTELRAEGLEGAGGHREVSHLRSRPGIVPRPPEPPSQPEEISGLENQKAEAGKSGCCGPCSLALGLENLGETPPCCPWTPDLGHGRRLQAGPWGQQSSRTPVGWNILASRAEDKVAGCVPLPFQACVDSAHCPLPSFHEAAGNVLGGGKGHNHLLSSRAWH